MKVFSYRIDQWNIGQRAGLLLTMLFIVGVIWYFFLEKPLLENNKIRLAKQTHDQELIKELHVFLASPENFIYQDKLQLTQLRHVFQDKLSKTASLTIANYADNPPILLPAGADQFPYLKEILHVTLLKMIQQSFTTITFVGTFNDFVVYLQALQQERSIYFDSINFNMNRYPRAEITMKVFTLGG